MKVTMRENQEPNIQQTQELQIKSLSQNQNQNLNLRVFKSMQNFIAKMKNLKASLKIRSNKS